MTDSGINVEKLCGWSAINSIYSPQVPSYSLHQSRTAAYHPVAVARCEFVLASWDCPGFPVWQFYYTPDKAVSNSSIHLGSLFSLNYSIAGTGASGEWRHRAFQYGKFDCCADTVPESAWLGKCCSETKGTIIEPIPYTQPDVLEQR